MRTIEYYHKRRKVALIALGGACVRCDSTDNLQLDHIDPATKLIQLSSDWYHQDWWIEVLEKCQILCRPCHLKKSGAEARIRQLAKGFTHGSGYAWMKLKCPCEVCQASKQTWNDKRNEKRRVKAGARGPYKQPAPHGSVRCYKRGCKCDACRAANAAQKRESKNTLSDVPTTPSGVTREPRRA